MFEWLTLWPTWADLPVNSHRRDMAYLWPSCAPANDAELRNLGSFGPRTYNDLGRARQVRDRSFGAGCGKDARTRYRASARRAEILFFDLPAVRGWNTQSTQSASSKVPYPT